MVEKKDDKSTKSTGDPDFPSDETIQRTNEEIKKNTKPK